MGIFKDLDTNEEIKGGESDNLGTSFTVIASGANEYEITSAYVTKSQNNAMAVNLETINADKQVLKQQLWVTSGKAKGCKTYYKNKEGEKQYLPGYLHANSICLLTVGKNLVSLDTTEQLVDVYDPKQKAKVPTKVDVISDLIGQKVILGVIKQTVNKRKKNPANGKYEPINEYRDENELDKVFRLKDHMTVAEIKAKAEEATFYDKWVEKWTDVTRDRTVEVKEKTAEEKTEEANSDDNLFA